MTTLTNLAVVFPGQGAQKVGMGWEFAERFPIAAHVYEEADAVLGFGLSKLCWEGPEEELMLTANTQPALLATSVAIYRSARERGLEPMASAGHSLGEYSALVAAGVLELAEALRLVRRRGELMQEAVPVGVGAMAAVLGLEASQVAQVVEEAATATEVCEIANWNANGQTVIAGHRPAVERAIELAKEAGGKRSILLPVSAPFHCSLMAKARQGLEPLLRQANFNDPHWPIVTNVDARPQTSGEALREALIRQVDSPVRWVDTVLFMADEAKVGAFCEIGPGKALSGMIRRTVDGQKSLQIGTLAELEAVFERD